MTMALLFLSACGQRPDAEEREGDTAERGTAGMEAASAPNVGVTRSPGVSLTYRYGFRLPAERIAAVQEEHAARCEALTAARCRITGMDYEVRSNRTIAAVLAMKLAPDIARGFGRGGVDVVLKRGGMLSRASIDSEESGAVVDAVDRDNADIAQERGRIEGQLAKPGLSAAERTQLQAQLTDLSNQKRQSAPVRDDAARKLAATPMTFTYLSGKVDPGLSDGPILGAIKDGWANIVAGFAIILRIAITLVPWALVIGLIIGLWRRFGRRPIATRE
jgi:hypothetical protein